MNDFDLATTKVGNRFDLVLVASERLREVHRARKLKDEEVGTYDIVQRKREPTMFYTVMKEIEDGKVGREYLQKVKSRGRRQRPKFDELK